MDRKLYNLFFGISFSLACLLQSFSLPGKWLAPLIFILLFSALLSNVSFSRKYLLWTRLLGIIGLVSLICLYAKMRFLSVPVLVLMDLILLFLCLAVFFSIYFDLSFTNNDSRGGE